MQRKVGGHLTLGVPHPNGLSHQRHSQRGLSAQLRHLPSHAAVPERQHLVMDGLRIMLNPFEVLGDFTEMMFPRGPGSFVVRRRFFRPAALDESFGEAKLGHGDAHFGPAGPVAWLEAVLQVSSCFDVVCQLLDLRPCERNPTYMAFSISPVCSRIPAMKQQVSSVWAFVSPTVVLNALTHSSRTLRLSGMLPAW